jgi:hypothetical protein
VHGKDAGHQALVELGLNLLRYHLGEWEVGPVSPSAPR